MSAAGPGAGGEPVDDPEHRRGRAPGSGPDGAADRAGAPAGRGGAVVLIGPPGAGCTSVGRALAQATGAPFADLAAAVAAALGTGPDLALVAAGERRYRRVEALAARALLEEALRRGGVVALGSGCLTDADVRALLRRLTAGGGRVVALTASARRLAGRNGLDAPRSVALGNVHHTFMQMLRAREAACRELASLNLDTTDTTPEQAAASVLREQDDAGDGAPAPDPRPPGAPGTPETTRPDPGPSRSATA
ncbi:shikimate kinase [Actinomyces sp. oral taxon 414]|uniref:shikimate kinase n=1 Tax=Actinomyces sp. oral taxon 414 TaxID=712122 RepID=UPI000AF0E989